MSTPQRRQLAGLSLFLLILLLLMSGLTVFLILQLQWAGRRTETLVDDVNVQATDRAFMAMVATQDIATVQWEWTLIWETQEQWENIAGTSSTQAAQIEASATAEAATSTAVRATLEAHITTAVVDAQQRVSTAESARSAAIIVQDTAVADQATAQSERNSALISADISRATEIAVATLSVQQAATVAQAEVDVANANAALYNAQYELSLAQAEAFNNRATADTAQIIYATELSAAQAEANVQRGTAQAAQGQLSQFSTEVAAIFTATASVPLPEAVLGPIVTASQLGSGGCPLERQSVFTGMEDRIYAIAENSTIPAGTSFYVRWYLENVPFFDSPINVSDRDVSGICVSFSLQRGESDTFTPGNYLAEFIVNGAPVGSTAFTVAG